MHHARRGSNSSLRG